VNDSCRRLDRCQPKNLFRRDAETSTRDACATQTDRSLTEPVAVWYVVGPLKETFMRSRTVAILTVTLAIAVFLSAGPLAAQPLEASRSHDVAHEVYAPSVTTAVYLVNFLLLYMANPDLAAYLPAYRAPIPQPVVDCLEQNPTGCPYADYRRYFDEQAFDNRECFWPDVCQENARWASLAPREGQTARTDQRAIGKEAGRPARSPPRHGRRHDP
jgi:hypothetical protein